MATEMVAPGSNGVWRHLRADPFLIGLSAVRRGPDSPLLGSSKRSQDGSLHRLVVSCLDTTRALSRVY